MKSREELKQLYEAELKPYLSEMEADRKAIRRVYIMMIISMIAMFVSFVVMLPYKWVAFGLFLVLMIFFGIKYKIKYSDFKEKFKSNIVNQIVKLINPEFEYNAKSHISTDAYDASGIYPTRYDSFVGDDLIKGVIGKTPFQFSEIHAEEKQTTTDSNGNTSTRWVTLFRGIFFFAEFNKKLEQRTFVVPEKAHRNILGKERSKVRGYGDLVKLENPDFEAVFSVYGTSQQEARYILTPAIMEAMLEVYNIFHMKMRFSFIGSNMYCGIPMSKNNFEPKIMKSVKYSDVEEMFFLFSFIETIITEMNLNTRIWTKE